MGILISISSQRWYISWRPFSKAEDRGFEPRLGQINDYKIVIYRASGTHITLSSKSNALLSRIQDNVPADLLLSATNISIKLSVLVLYKADFIIISSNVTYFRHDIP
jgi:hypothetical protein